MEARSSTVFRSAVAAALIMLGLIVVASVSRAEVRVQDIARLQGQRTNKLAGWGLVVGLDGSGDGPKSPSTLRALMEVHKRYLAPVLDIDELSANKNVAIVSIEVTLPEFGAREGQAIDVLVSAVGPAKSIKGGRLLTTPLQDSLLRFPDVLALASGRIDVADPKNPKVGVIRGGAVLEEDFFYNFILDGSINLVLDQSRAGFQWSQVVARAINHELATPAAGGDASGKPGRAVAANEFAAAIDAQNIRVRIPAYEAARPAGFISRVLQTKIFAAPDLPARVVINRVTSHVSFTGAVTIAPTVLELPGLGAISVGGGGGQAPPSNGVIGLDTEKTAGVEFQELLATLSKLQLPPEQIVQAVEHLHRTGTLNAQLIYTE